MKIIELFVGLQGEGVRTGVPSTFIRVEGCNLHCVACDTKYSFKGGEEMSIDQIIKYVQEQGLRDTVVTGGEPILPKRKKDLQELLSRLWELNKFITVETNATYIIPDIIPYVSLWSLSPKLHSMGPTKDYNINVIYDYVRLLKKDQMQLKFVIDLSEETKASLDHILDNFLIQIKEIPVIFQPVEINLKDNECYAEMIKENFIKLTEFASTYKNLNIRVLPQMHKIFFGTEIGV